MNNLNTMLQNSKKRMEERGKTKPMYNGKKYVTFIKNKTLYLKANFNFVNYSLKCSYCMQHGYLRNYYYVKRNMNLGMHAKWLAVERTNSTGLNQTWVPKN